MSYTPITTMFNTPLSTTSATVLSPLTPFTIKSVSPLSPISTVVPVSIKPVSPLSPLSVSIPLSPVSTVSQSIIRNNDQLTVVTPIGPIITPVRPSYMIDIDTGMDNNYYVQRDVTKYLLYKTLDKWIFDEFPSILKYLVVDKDHVKIVKSEEEKDKNDISKNTSKENEMKVDWIEENILGEDEMKDILKKIMMELGLKWYDLPHRETLVMEVVEKYLKKKLRNKMES